VFAQEHPDIQLLALGASPAVAQMIRHVAGDRAAAMLGTDEAC
jgi:hypothetical protein